MSVLDVLDATRLCGRWSDELTDPTVWARPVPVAVRSVPVPRHHSWTSFARNPRAILMTGLVGADLAVGAMLRVLR